MSSLTTQDASSWERNSCGAQLLGHIFCSILWWILELPPMILLVVDRGRWLFAAPSAFSRGKIMQCQRSVLTLAAAIATAVGSVFAAANAAQAQTVVHVRTADLKVSDTANVKIEPVHYGYYHSYYRAPYGYYARPYRAYYAPYRAYYGGAYAAWYGNPYYAYPNYYSLPYYGPTYYGSYYGPSPYYYGYPTSAYYAPVPSVGVYVGPRVGVVVRRGSFYW